MPVLSRSRLCRLATALLTVLAAVALLLTYLPTRLWAHSSKHKTKSSSTTTWSGSSSDKGVRTEIRRSGPEGSGYTTTYSDEDRPGEVDAWAFSRDNGRWRNNSGSSRDWKEVVWAITTRVDPARDTLIAENTPIDYLDFASPVSGLGSKMGIDATNKWPGETSRTWGRPIVMDEAVRKRIDQLWRELGL